MTTTIKTAPGTSPITLAQLKDQLYIVDDTTYDLHLQLLIDAATEWVEQFLCRKLVTQTWYAYLDKFPASDAIMVPFGNLQSVTAVKYTDYEEDETTLDAGDYLVDTDNVPGRIILAYGEVWPTDTLSPRNPIEVEFVTGYGEATAVPEPIKNAIKMICAQNYEHREAQEITNMINIHSLDFDPRAMLYPYRVWEWAI